MKNIPKTDQWKLNGNCDKCRRKDYCHTKCSARKTTQQIILNASCDAIMKLRLEEILKEEQ